MTFAIWCIVIGATAGAVAFVMKPLFVNTSDVRNPMRSLVMSLGYAGIAIAIYGVILIIVQT